MERVCERCAGDDDDLELVRSPGQNGAAGTGAEGELWCFECRAAADHVPLDEA
ncbi:MAG TPA: hypothetical protein VM263_08435 [Acidimicrobiales bacterium]|nr:hypothetical protein [Acidimicrobiales bacterium]